MISTTNDEQSTDLSKVSKILENFDFNYHSKSQNTSKFKHEIKIFVQHKIGKLEKQYVKNRSQH